jgi:hypothetical protein
MFTECDVVEEIGFGELREYISCRVWQWRGLITELLALSRYGVGSGTKLDCRTGCCEVDGWMVGSRFLDTA